jgi:hypothetical protein
MLCFLKYFCRKKNCKNIGAFWLKTKLNYTKNWSLLFKKKRQYFAENWRKLQKIVIITSTPATALILWITSVWNVKKIFCKSSQSYYWIKIIYKYVLLFACFWCFCISTFCMDINTSVKTGANPTTFEFTTTTPAL